MLITSKFRDFYDNCAAYGVDTKVVYHRVTEEVRNPRGVPGKIPDPDPQVRAVEEACRGWGPRLGERWDWESGTRRGRLFVDVMVLGIAGNLYKFVTWNQEKTREDSLYLGRERKSVFVKESFPPELIGKFTSFRDMVPLADYFEELQTRNNPDIFVELNCPIFISDGDMVIKNPELKGWGITHLKDGVTIFQEISAFISGTLATAKQMKHTASDQELIQAHGFDKHSFRKGKQK